MGTANRKEIGAGEQEEVNIFIVVKIRLSVIRFDHQGGSLSIHVSKSRKLRNRRSGFILEKIFTV